MNKGNFIEPGFFIKNNFDLLRLLAASQVVIVHGITHLQVEFLYPLVDILNFFPGVPVFFFLSGFLISAAWERNPDIKSFFGNRFYRIFPGLWFCVLVSVLLVTILSIVLNIKIPYFLLSAWAFMQGTIFPQWNPSFLEWFGTGVVNGSLWTIPVEMSFYILLPLIYIFSQQRNISISKIFVSMMLFSFAVFYALILSSPESDIQKLIIKIIGFSAIPWFGMFCAGVLVQKNINFIYPYVVNKAHIFFIIFIAFCFLGSFFNNPFLFGVANDIGILNYIVLCIFVTSFGYTFPFLADKLLNRNDISYGVYIYHMPIFNCLIIFDMLGMNGLLFGIFLTLFLSLMSWFFIEKPSLRKRKSFLYNR